MLVITLAKYFLIKLATKATSSAINKFERKIRGKEAARAGKEFILFISNEDMDDIINIVDHQQETGILIDGDTKTVKQNMKQKKQEGRLLGARMAFMAASLIAPMASSLIQAVASSTINAITGK